MKAIKQYVISFGAVYFALRLWEKSLMGDLHYRSRGTLLPPCFGQGVSKFDLENLGQYFSVVLFHAVQGVFQARKGLGILTSKPHVHL